ncbi:AAA family ATPase [Aureibacter tunicatorum]|uniref:SpoVK/Ycf46/Vps4 family AAA+-type ATPase n=1 Tax=Aureibacter tunicatorum TaxID=866807 RepID=A0AAE4BU15_9BACT|nr:ATP-binding protein [Aureibacter tunicatorum]MDR6240535.1 SpoVK/Ycf46/Vps4 family AAA+-type ATPase [Aureibacter tunicatorum]BDD06604.1 hypothetical protein AUTU_40870 [Aureibacter tunicatorum]
MVNDYYYDEVSSVTFDDIIYDNELQNSIDLILKEYEHIETLHKYGLPINHKFLFHGHTGCGKTTTAKAIANKLNKRLFVVNLGTIVSSKLGETARNINSIFKKAMREHAIVFFDEFDSLGKIRDYDKDSSEMKRVVNSIIQLLDYLPYDCMVIAATNQIQMIDEAILRRFEMKLTFKAPEDDLLDIFYKQLLAKFPEKYHNIEKQYGVSYAEAKVLSFNQIKKMIISGL